MNARTHFPLVLTSIPFLALLMGCGGEHTGFTPGHGPSIPPAPKSAPAPTTLSTESVGLPMPSSSGVQGLDPDETAFLALINDYREQYGLGRLVASATLTASSRWMSTDMAAQAYFSHTDSQGRSWVTRMADFNYNYSTYEGENIAAGNPDALATFYQWRNSPPHNANMLNPNYQVIGIGHASLVGSSYVWYWTTDFGGYVDSVIAR